MLTGTEMVLLVEELGYGLVSLDVDFQQKQIVFPLTCPDHL
jgi:hypothetical protein